MLCLDHCRARTKKRVQCKRNARSNGFCDTHKKCVALLRLGTFPNVFAEPLQKVRRPPDNLCAIFVESFLPLTLCALLGLFMLCNSNKPSAARKDIRCRRWRNSCGDKRERLMRRTRKSTGLANQLRTYLWNSFY